MSTVLVTGANRGLGLEFVRQYAADGWRIHAACRHPGAAAELNDLSDHHSSISVHSLDVASTESIVRLEQTLAGEPIDVLLNNAGVFGPRPGADSDPRQSFGTIDGDVWLDVMRVNALAPLMVTQALIRNVAASEQKKVVTISSELGSIADTSGGYYAYRCSKSAVNMAMASLARELEGQGILVGVFCPGWVSTAMGGADAPLDPGQSVTGLRARIAALGPADSGRFRTYDGRVLDW